MHKTNTSSTTINTPNAESDSSASSQQLATKIIQDINFLKDRIERVKRLHTPNSSVLRTYESMLSTRLAVLDWMRDNGQLGPQDVNEISSMNECFVAKLG